MPYINYDDAVSLLAAKMLEHGVEPGQYIEDPIIVPSVRWNAHMLKIEQVGIKDGTVIVFQMFFELANSTYQFRRYTKITKGGCNVNMLRDIVIMASRPDFESSNGEVMSLDLGGFNIEMHRRMPKTVAARAVIKRGNSLDDLGGWIDATISGSTDTLLRSSAIYTLMSAVVDGDVSDIFDDTAADDEVLVNEQ